MLPSCVSSGKFFNSILTISLVFLFSQMANSPSILSTLYSPSSIFLLLSSITFIKFLARLFMFTSFATDLSKLFISINITHSSFLKVVWAFTHIIFFIIHVLFKIIKHMCLIYDNVIKMRKIKSIRHYHKWIIYFFLNYQAYWPIFQSVL